MIRPEVPEAHEPLELTPEQTRKAMLAMLNKRVGVRGNAGAMQVLADALDCHPGEAVLLTEFDYAGVHFEKRYVVVRHGRSAWMDWRWQIVKENGES